MIPGLLLMKSVLTPSAKNVLSPCGLSAAMSATYAAAIQKNHGSGTTSSIISNEEMEDIMKIVNSLEESGLLTLSGCGGGNFAPLVGFPLITQKR